MKLPGEVRASSRRSFHRSLCPPNAIFEPTSSGSPPKYSPMPRWCSPIAARRSETAGTGDAALSSLRPASSMSSNDTDNAYVACSPRMPQQCPHVVEVFRCDGWFRQEPGLWRPRRNVARIVGSQVGVRRFLIGVVSPHGIGTIARNWPNRSFVEK